MYPTKLNKIIHLFETLPEDERRETIVSYAENAKKQEPRKDEQFDLVDVRKDEECMDTVGVYLHVDENGKAQIRMTLGPEVQTLTRAMTAILCKGLEGCMPQEILDLPSDFVRDIPRSYLEDFATGFLDSARNDKRFAREVRLICFIIPRARCRGITSSKKFCLSAPVRS